MRWESSWLPVAHSVVRLRSRSGSSSSGQSSGQVPLSFGMTKAEAAKAEARNRVVNVFI
jgi:hypothetical protein